MAAPATPVPPIVDEGVAAAAGNETFKPTFEDQMIAYSAIYSMALICVVWGSVRSLNYVKRVIAKGKYVEASLHTKDALWFPLKASLALFTLYIVFKSTAISDGVELARTHVLPKVPEQYHQYFDTAVSYLPQGNGTALKFDIRGKLSNLHPTIAEYIKYVPEATKDNFITLLVWLMAFEGVSCIATIFTAPVVTFLLRLLPIGNRWPRKNHTHYIVWKTSKEEIEEGDIEEAPSKDVEKSFELEFNEHWFYGLLIAAPIAVYHLLYRHWITNNLIAIGFSIIGIELLHVASFKAGVILLCGLFFYDIFWVFGTDVMTTVAKSVNAPILLMFPQDLIAHGWREASKHGMLGLGDIVIPGIFIALLRRFDAQVFEKTPTKSRYYFIATMTAYVLGLFATIAVMHVFKAAQPALLYLVPACISVPVLLSLIRGEFTELWNYSEEKISEKAKAEKKEKKKEDKKTKSHKKD
uniref:Minor histocompatibility antigen H13 n=1 Tax=Panagrellus redivivus TaxID=6233 RepID=A0A7E4W4S4_PANRE